MPADQQPLVIDYPQISLRFVMRDLGGLHRARVLQQLWVKAEVQGGITVPIETEWRDVPLVEEASGEYRDSDGRTSAQRWQQGLPEREKPPLGQPPAFLQDQVDTSDIPEAGEDWFAKARLEPDDRVAGIKMMLTASVKANEALLERMQEVSARLPKGMERCTIVFEECPKGHGSLRATNWSKQPCAYCRIQKQQLALKYVVDNPGAHPANMVAVAKEGLEP